MDGTFTRRIISRFKFVLILVCIPVLAASMSCTAKPDESIIANDEPTPPLSFYASFDDAPILNHEIVLSFVARAPYIGLRDVSIKLRLPDSIRLVSGNLSWDGDISYIDELEIIRVIVKATETGNGQIDYHAYWDITKQELTWFKPGDYWVPALYFHVSENSGEWRTSHSYDIANRASDSSQEELPPPPEIPIDKTD